MKWAAILFFGIAYAFLPFAVYGIKWRLNRISRILEGKPVPPLDGEQVGKRQAPTGVKPALPLLILALLLLPCPAFAAEKSVYPSQGPDGGFGSTLYFIQVKGFEIKAIMGGDPTLWNPVDFRINARGGVYNIGIWGSLSSDPRVAADGEIVKAAAYSLAFPELGDSAKDAPGACYCSGTIGESEDPFNVAPKMTGKGKCDAGVTCYVKGVQGQAKS
ncbi:MAG TPA: hypothetical protein VGR67_01795 [Candidatus Polarisedimenticolia bacterium]|nr:hypothetical protein [Candidatus Polarisedimenticolia bacterium]